MKRWAFFGAAVVAGLAGAALRASSPGHPSGGMAEPNAPATRPAVAVSAELRRMAGRLASAEFAAREAAQKEIEGLPAGRRDEVAALLGEVTDPESKARLQKCLDVMEDELAINPPPLELHMQNATRQELMQSLADQLQQTLKWGAYGPDEAKITLDMGRVSFGELARRLPVGFRIGFTELPTYSKYDVYKGFTTYFAGLATTKSVSMDGAVKEGSRLDVKVMPDPRVRVFGIGGAHIMRVEDNAGHVISNSNPGDYAARLYMTRSQWTDSPWFMMSGQMEFAIPKDAGDRLVSVKGETEFLVASGEECVVIEDVEKHNGETLRVGGLSVQLKEFGMKQDVFGGTVTAVNFESGNFMFRMVLFNADGKPSYSYREPVYGGEWISFGKCEGPCKLALYAPQRVLRVKVPFELKDIAYPH